MLRNCTLPLLHVDHSCCKITMYNIDVCMQNKVGHRFKVPNYSSKCSVRGGNPVVNYQFMMTTTRSIFREWCPVFREFRKIKTGEMVGNF